MSLPDYIEGIGSVAHRYEGFILDLWGVVHDGIKPLPFTIDTLKQMKKAHRRIWMLSNAPRRAHVVEQKLNEMGVGPELYDGIMTSGEASHMALRDKYLAKWGRKCYHLGPHEKDKNLYEGLDIIIVEKPSEANFVLNTGVKDFDDTAEQYAPVLAECIAAKLPMLCANPDRVVHVEDKLVVCPGAFADMYEKLEGEVQWFGKPYRSVYTECLKGLAVENVLAVGDGMMTDIAGATGAGLDSALVTGGIHRDELLEGVLQVADETRLREFMARYPYRPSYLLSAFFW
jgi:HAD superfamily hydrolase (TIGR01459 family)